jgi:hypothetical protein
MAGKRTSGDLRRAERRAIGLRAQLREFGGGKIEVEVEDLSTTGFRVESIYRLAVGQRVYIAIPSFAPFEAQIAWAAGGHYGCRFVQPLHPAVFDLIVARHRDG